VGELSLFLLKLSSFELTFSVFELSLLLLPFLSLLLHLPSPLPYLHFLFAPFLLHPHHQYILSPSPSFDFFFSFD
jgi:hypothetical protein